MKFQAKIDGENHDVEIHRKADTVTAKVGKREYVLEVSQPEPNVYSLRSGSARTEAFVSPVAGPGGKSRVIVDGHEFEVELTDPKRLRGSGRDAEHGDGKAEIRTAMPGKVVRILVEKGAAIEKGDGVLVVEAMKMQNELKSPKAGTVKEIRVEEGSTVSAGDILAVIE